MRHTFLKAVLTVGLLGGLLAGFAGCHHHGHHRYAQMEEKVTDICTTAVKQALADERRMTPVAPPPAASTPAAPASAVAAPTPAPIAPTE